MNKFEIIYYLGVLLLISSVVYIMINKLKTFDKILKEHIFIIIVYISLLIFSIILWEMIIIHIKETSNMLHVTPNYKKIING